MSSWIVSKAHIDALVQACLLERLIPDLVDPTDFGRELWRENHRSVNYRYSERTRTPRYVFTGIEAPLNPIAVSTLVHCYRYQSCDHAEWDSSQSCQVIEALLARLTEKNGGVDPYDTPGVDHQPWWGINRLEQAILHGPVTLERRA